MKIKLRKVGNEIKVSEGDVFLGNVPITTFEHGRPGLPANCKRTWDAIDSIFTSIYDRIDSISVDSALLNLLEAISTGRISKATLKVST